MYTNKIKTYELRNEDLSVEFAKATSLQWKVLEQLKKSDYFQEECNYILSNFCFIIIWYIVVMFPVYQKCSNPQLTNLPST